MNGTMVDNVPLFAGLTAAQRSVIAERMVLQTYSQGQALYQQGEPATRMYLIKSGWVRLVTGETQILANISQGGLLGDADLLLGHNHSTTAMAFSEVQVLSLTAEDLAEIVAGQLEIGLQLSKVFGTTVEPLKRYLVERRLRALPGFVDLPDEALATVAGRLCVHLLPAGERLFSVGEAPSGLYLIERGRVAAGDGHSDEYGPGELVGEPNVLVNRAHTLTAAALEPCWLWELSTGDLDKLCAAFPELRRTLADALRVPLSSSDVGRAVAILKVTPLFQSLPPAALDALAGRLGCQAVPAGTRICEASSPARAMYFVESGAVELLNPRNEVVARVTAGGYFGEAALVPGSRYEVAAQTKGNATLWALAAEDVDTVSHEYPDVRQVLTSELGSPERTQEHFAERYLRHLSLFAGMSTEQLHEVAGRLRLQQYRAGEAVYRRGAPCKALYIIEEGQISLQTRGSDGKVQVLGTLGAGELFGEAALLSGEPHSEDGFARTDSAVWALLREDFEALVQRHPVLALNLSRVLSQRLRQSHRPPAGQQRPAPVPARHYAAEEPEPQPVATPQRAAAPNGGLGHAINSAFAWFASASTGTKLRLLALLLLIIWLLGVAAPSIVISLLSSNNGRGAVNVQASLLSSSGLVAFAADPVEATATYTPWPTDTPIPTPTDTPTAVPTDTPVPTATTAPTETPVPPTNTPVPPSPTPQPVVARQEQEAPVAVAAAEQAAAPPAEAPQPPPAASSARYSLAEQRRLTPCENGGMHNIFVKIVDAAGNPVDGVQLVQVPHGSIGNVLDRAVSGSKGPGQAEFVMWKMAEYDVYVTEDGSNPAGGADIAQQLHSNFTDEASCGDGGGNTLFHNSFSVIFRKNF